MQLIPLTSAPQKLIQAWCGSKLINPLMLIIMHWWWQFNSLAPGRFHFNFRSGVAVQLTSCAAWCSQGFGYFGPLLRSGTSPKFHWSEVLVPGLRMCHRLLEANGFSYLNIRMNFGHGILFVASWRYYISPDGLDKQHPCLWLAALGLD